MNRKFPIDDQFFMNWSHNMAYITGFLYADGCIARKDQKNYDLSICLKDTVDNVRI